MPPVQLKNTKYGKHRQDPDVPPATEPLKSALEFANVLPWDDEPVDEKDTPQPPEE